MARINSYPVLSSPSTSDLLIATDVSETGNPTKTLSIQDLSSLIATYNLGYTVYTAQLTAGPGAAPTAIILQNTTGLTFTWTRIGTGQFIATVAGTPFVANKFWAMVSAKGSEFPSVVRTADNIARVDNILCSTGQALDGITEGFIEIRIYS